MDGGSMQLHGLWVVGKFVASLWTTKIFPLEFCKNNVQYHKHHDDRG